MDEKNPPTAKPADKRRRRRRWLRRGILIVVLGGCVLAGRPLFRDMALWRARTAIDDRNHQRALTWLNVASSIESWLNFATSIEEENAEFHFLSARVHRRLEHFARVRKHLKQAHELGWNTSELEREQWIAQAQTGQFAEMSQHFPELFTNAGSDGPEISQAFVLIMLSRFRLDSARKVLDAWQKDFPEDPKPHLLRGRVLTVVRNWKEAEREYAAALKLSPGNDEARFQLANCLMQRLQFQEAELYLLECLEENPPKARAVVALAVCLRKRQRIDEARSLLQTHWNAVKTDMEALREMGQLELAAERPQAALPHLKAAVKARPVDRESRYAYYQALRAAGHAEEARKELVFVNEATKPVMRLGTLMPKLIDQPKNVPLRFEIAEITWKYKSRAEGAKWFHSVLQFDSNHAATHRALAAHYDLIGDKSRADSYRKRSRNTESKR